VLTGLNIGRYAAGEGLPGGPGLGGLLDYLLGGTERIRLRLSSLEPDDIDGALLESLANRRLRPHFHLSVQSGSGRVLRRMGRLYGPERVDRAVSQLRRLREDPFIACDIITGFPGEGEAEFEETAQLCGRADFAWIHSFPYSPRPGTAAWNFGERVPQREAASRVARLLDLARRGRRNYTARWLGKEVEVVLEGRGSPAPAGPEDGEGFRAGTSENYLKVLIPRPWLPGAYGPGGILRCRLRPELPGAWPPVPAGPRRDTGGPGNFDALGYPVPCTAPSPEQPRPVA
jgi:threonylcarbamoyladenosine tRNA methylthiotransferase MtaB